MVRIRPLAPDPVVERLGHADRFLASHGVGHEQDLGRLHAVADIDQLLHQAVVDLEAAGGVDDDRVVAALAGIAQRVGGDVDRVLAGAFLIDGNADLLAQRLQLVDGGRAIDIGGDHVDDDKFEAEVAAVAGKLASAPTYALALAKQALAASSANTLAQQLDLERDLQRLAGASPDAREGINAFLEKRAPKYTGRKA